MKLNIEKKILSSDKNPKHKVLFGIVLISLFVFLFGFFISFNIVSAQTAAEPLKISAIPGNPVEVGNVVQIIARTYLIKAKEVRFYSWPKVKGFDSVAKCTVAGNYSEKISICYVEFNSSTKGSYKINASITTGSITYQANSIIINVTEKKPTKNVTIVTTSLKPTSVILKAENLTPNTSTTFHIDFTDTKTPSYNKSQITTSDVNGTASSKFSGLSPRGNYVGNILLIPDSPTVASVYFTTPNPVQNIKNRLIISTNKSSLKRGGNTTITAKLKIEIPEAIGKIIYFSSSTNESGLSPKTCTIPKIPQKPTCSVGFSSLTEGSFPLSAKTTIGKLYESNIISITVKGCPEGQILGANAVCITPKPINPLNTLNKTKDTKTSYNLLAPLPGIGKTIETTGSCAFGNYLNIIIKLIIGFAAVLAMVMIIAGGIEYMTSDSISSKESGKKTIINAILGLLIALSSYLILNTINPKLLTVCLKLPPATVIINPEQVLTIKNRTGGGTCEVITDQNSSCYPDKLKTNFVGNTSKIAPFNTLSAQASAICQLESQAVVDRLSSLDKCSDNKPFSFGLFQINASAHRNEIPACKNAFKIPTGHGNSQGNPLHKYDITKNGKKYIARWSCETVEPAYTECKNYLTNSINNIKYASTLQSKQGWGPWTTYNSCKSKF